MAYQAPGVYIVEASTVAPIAGVGTSTAAFIGMWADPAPADDKENKLAKAGVVVPCTNFTEFATRFGGFSSTVVPQNLLAHAVRGFFTNGGTFCYVVRVATTADVKLALETLEAYDDISIVAAPGLTGKSTATATVPAAGATPAVAADTAAAGTVVDALVAHCTLLQDRIAILDAPDVAPVDLAKLLTGGASVLYKATDFAALYTPWLAVHNPPTDTLINVPPSGHVAGIYARTDATRGVHKAPANEVVLGARDAAVKIGQAQQATINLQGANCIRMMSGALKVWGARTLAGDSGTRAHFKYIPIRRLMSFLYKSIDHGTQWAVFEPNGPELWAKIIRNVGSFLTSIWAQGALAGTTPAEAFFVKCDAENNPPDERAKGLLYIEVGVAVLYPAEFVVFKIQHQSSLAK